MKLSKPEHQGETDLALDVVALPGFFRVNTAPMTLRSRIQLEARAATRRFSAGDPELIKHSKFEPQFEEFDRGAWPRQVDDE